MILIGVDFLDGSRAALDQARSLSSAAGIPLEILYVRDYGEGGPWNPHPDQLEWLESAKLAPSDVQTRQGVPWVELVRYARERGAAMIVAGRHGGSGAHPFSLGSTALRLATHAPDPVLLVSGAQQRTEMKNRVFARDGEPRPGSDESSHGGSTRSDAG